VLTKSGALASDQELGGTAGGSCLLLPLLLPLLCAAAVDRPGVPGDVQVCRVQEGL